MPLSGKFRRLCHRRCAFPNKIALKVRERMGNSPEEKWLPVAEMRNDRCPRPWKPAAGPFSVNANRAPRCNNSGSPWSINSFYAFVSGFLVSRSTDSTITKVFNLASGSSRKCKFFFSMLRDARFRNIFLKSCLIVERSLKMPGKWDITLFKKRVHIYT